MPGELRKILNRIDFRNYRTKYEVFEKVIKMWDDINPNTVSSADLSSCDALLKKFNFDQTSKSYYETFLNPSMLFIKLLLNIIHGSKQATLAHSSYKSMLESLGRENSRVRVYCQNAVGKLGEFVSKKITAVTLEKDFRKTISDIRKTVLESLNTMYDTSVRLSLRTFLGTQGMTPLTDFVEQVNAPGSDLSSSVYDETSDVEQIKKNEEAIKKLDIIVELMSKVYGPRSSQVTSLNAAIEECKKR